MKFASKEITEDRKKALEKIIEILDSEEKLNEVKNRTVSGTHDKNIFVVTWKSNYHGMPAEERIDITDSFYKSYSGFGAIHCNVGLFHQKQIKGYSTVERALLEVGLKLSKSEKSFIDKYIVPYNDRLKAQRNDAI